MKTVQSRLAVLTAVVLGSLAVLVPAAPAAPADPPVVVPPAVDPETREAPQSVFTGTGIGVVLAANRNEVPKNGAEMMKVLNGLGEFVQLPIGFSAVAMHSGLKNPRVVITQKPSMIGIGRLGDGRPDPSDFLPGGPAVAPVSKGTLIQPNLEGRLYLAANLERDGGQLKVKTFEFISWNSRKKRFDFGFIECDDVEPQIRVVDGVKCFSCHKNKGPILGQGPWSNTTHNDAMREATAAALKVDLVKLCLPTSIGQPRRLDTGLEPNPNVVRRDVEYDGLTLLIPQGPAVDAAVRLGAESVRDREVFKLMTKTVDGRRGLVHLLSAIVVPGPIEKANESVKIQLNNDFGPSYPAFAAKVKAIHRTSSSTLADFNPAGAQGRLVNQVTASGGGWGSGPTLQSHLKIVWGGSSNQVTEYDNKRSDGQPALPSNHQPSNPKAFVPAPAPTLNQPSSVVSAQQLARVIGLTESDRDYLGRLLDQGVRRVNKSKVTAAVLARDALTRQEFAELLLVGELPDREDFKDRFVAGLNGALKDHGAEQLAVERKDYASGPNVSVALGKDEIEPPIVATTACVRCHDVLQPGKAAFSPIPMLAFDPYDKDSRETWVAVNRDAKKRVTVIGRMLKRMADDRDMPPEDSAEYEAFRAKNVPEFDAMKDWLAAELRRAKGE
jgi:hypothetical protein